MSFFEITSASNPKFKRWKKLLSSSQARRIERAFIAEGAHAGFAALDSGTAPVCVITRKGELGAEACTLLKSFSSTSVYRLDKKLYESIAPVPEGIGLMYEFNVPEEKELYPIRADAVYLDGVQDAGNAGTILRTALAAGVTYAATSAGSVDLYSPKTLRAGMGAQFSLHIMQGIAPSELKSLFKARILCAEAKGGTSIYSDPAWAKGHTIWIFGSEGQGVSQAALSSSDQIMYVPIDRRSESLNVSAAAAVCLFEQCRLRNRGGAA